MLIKIILLVFTTTFIISSNANDRKRPTFSPYVRNHTYPKYKYPKLYRDQVYTELSEKGKELFFAVNIHPSCVAKKGTCMPRGQCKQPNMLYISRVCYKHDLVCCYNNAIKFPSVHQSSFTAATSTAAPALRTVSEGIEPNTTSAELDIEVDQYSTVDSSPEKKGNQSEKGLTS